MTKIKSSIYYVLLLAIPLVFFFKIFLGFSIISGDFSGSDLMDLHLPFRFAMNKAISSGNIPLWENNMSMGFPLFAEGQMGFLYPPNLLLSLVKPEVSLNLTIIFVFLISLYSSYYYFHLLKSSSFASFFGSIAYSFSAFFITRIKHVNMINTASLMPLLFIFTYLFFKKKELKYLIFNGLTIAFMIFAGHPQITFYCILINIVYAIFEGISNSETKNKSISTIFFFITISLFLSFGLSAIQTIPTLELTSLSPRTEFTEVVAKAYPFHPKNLILLISPYFFGNPATGTYSLDIKKFGIFWENNSYFGLIPLALSFYWIKKTLTNKNKDRYSMFFIFLAFISLLLVLGPFTPLFPFLLKIIPFLTFFRFPTRFNLFLIFALAYLSTKYFDFILQKINQKYTNRVGILLNLLLIIDLLIFANSYLGYIPNKILTEKPKVLEYIQKDGYYRTYSLTQYSESPYAVLGWMKDFGAISAIRNTLPPNNNIIYDIDSFTDRGWFEGGFGLKERTNVENFLLKENQNQGLTGRILGMFNVKYILSFDSQIGIDIEKIAEIDLGKDFAQKLNVFENGQFIPRAYFVPEAIVAKNKTDAFEKIKGLDFLPTKSVILEEQPLNPSVLLTQSLDDYIKENEIKIEKYENNRVIISADIKSHGFLVLSDTNYPGWKATVNSKETKILSANYLVRAIELEPGKYEIVFYFDSSSYKLGFWITTFFVVLLISSSVAITVNNNIKKNKGRNKD